MKYFKVSFYLSSGTVLEALIEDEGLLVSDVRDAVDATINDGGTYTILNVLNNEWVIIQGNRIDAFSIQDLGPQGLKLADEGFIFK